MADRVVKAVGGEFSLDRRIRAAGSVSEGISSLDHKAVHNPVEGEPVIKALLCQLHEILHGLGRGAGIQGQGDRPVVLDLDLDMMEVGRGDRGLPSGGSCSIRLWIIFLI